MKNYAVPLVLLLMVATSLGACQPAPVPVPDTPAVSPTGVPTPTSLPPGPFILWAFPTQGAVWSTPAAGGDRVYFGSDDHHLYAVAALSGELVWKAATDGYVRSQPALSADRVYFTSDDGYLYAVQQGDGSLAWRTDTGSQTPPERRANLGSSPDPKGYDYMQSSPVVVGDLVYAGSYDGQVYALDAQTGEIRWTFQTGGPVRANPAIENGKLYIGSWDETFYALDAATGDELWRTPVGGEVQSTAILVEGKVICASRKASVFALQADTGELAWEYGFGNNMWVESSPRLYNGVVYIGSSGSQRVTGLHPDTGKPFTLFMTKMFNWSTPLVVDDTLYIGSTNFENIEKSGLLAIGMSKGVFQTSSQYLYLLTGGESLDAKRGWSGVASSPVLSGGLIYYGSLDGKLYALIP